MKSQSLGAPVTVLDSFGAPPAYLQFQDVAWLVTDDNAITGKRSSQAVRDRRKPHWAPISEIEAIRKRDARLEYASSVLTD